MKHEAGYIEIATPDNIGGVRMMTKQCVHCHKHFVSKKPDASIKKALTPYEAAFLEAQGKTVRGYCMNCDGPVCGPNCVECVPAEKKLEIGEGTADPNSFSVFGGF